MAVRDWKGSREWNTATREWVPGDTTLVVANASHAQAAGSPVLIHNTDILNLTVSDVAQAHAIDSPVLIYSETGVLVVAPADCYHAFTDEQPIINVPGVVESINVFDAAQAQAAGNFEVNQYQQLVLFDASHSASDSFSTIQYNDNIILVTAIDAAQTHTAEAVALTVSIKLGPISRPSIKNITKPRTIELLA